MASDAETTLAELSHHGAEATHTIRFKLDMKETRMLDLTDDAVARAWGYDGGPISESTKALGSKARESGFNLIAFPSQRGSGSNFAVIGDFDRLLSPQMISPAK